MIEAAAVLYLISWLPIEVTSFVAEHRRLSGLRPYNGVLGNNRAHRIASFPVPQSIALPA